jgi:hypothetical protein
MAKQNPVGIYDLRFSVGRVRAYPDSPLGSVFSLH